MGVLLSVIVPAYNVAPYLEACVSSILSSTFQDYELLLIDDGSTDETGAFCDALAERSDKIRVFHSENRGLCGARNLGLDNASGTYISFVDGDDIISPRMLETLVSGMEPDVQLSACHFVRCKRTDPRPEKAGPYRVRKTDQTGCAQAVLPGGFGCYVWNKLFCRSILDAHQIRFRTGRNIPEDQVFIMDYLPYCSQAVFFYAGLYYYIMNDGSIMNSFREQSIVSDRYIGLPRAWAYSATVVQPLSGELEMYAQSFAAMFYQTVLRKLEAPDETYIQEAVAYVKQHRNTLLRNKLGLKYYLSAVLLSASYPLWAKIFRSGIRKKCDTMNQPTLIVSLDFELFWGMQDGWELSEYEANVLGGREAIPQMLELFQKHGIHTTWATVGFQFARSEEELRTFFPAEKPSYTNEKRSAYRCFGSIGRNEQEAPCFYAPSLIEQIAAVPGQEIGSHTFSHYYCREAGQTTGQFRADMEAAKAIAAACGYDLKSVVLPRNQCEPEYTKVLADLGFTSYRDEENDWIHEKVKFRPLMRILRLMDVYFPLTGQGGYVPKTENGIVNLTGSRMYKPCFKPLAFLEGLKVRRIRKQMLHAAKNGLTFHLWWHPHNVGVHTDFHMQQLEEIFSYYDELKEQYGMRSLNMGEAAREVLNR